MSLVRRAQSLLTTYIPAQLNGLNHFVIITRVLLISKSINETSLLLPNYIPPRWTIGCCDTPEGDPINEGEYRCE